MFYIVFILVFGIIVFTIISAISRGIKNNNSPRLNVNALVVTKRTGHSRNMNNNMYFTRYYVTFEVESGDRMELQMTGEEYGLLAEGDRGVLTFQGTRYLGFERERMF